jgi:hypothetical protein
MLAPFSELAFMICWTTTEALAEGSAAAATDHSVWPGWTTIWVMPACGDLPGAPWPSAATPPAVAIHTDIAVAVAASAANVATTRRPRRVSRSAAGRAACRMAGFAGRRTGVDGAAGAVRVR